MSPPSPTTAARARRAGQLVALLGALGLLVTAAAQAARALEPRWGISEGALRVSVDLSGEVEALCAEDAESGLTQRLLLRLRPVLSPAADAPPWERRCAFRYDLWAERFLIEIQDPGGAARRLTTQRPAEAWALCGQIEDAALGPTPEGAREAALVAELSFDDLLPGPGEGGSRYVGDPTGHRSGPSRGGIIGAVARLFFRASPDEGPPPPALRLEAPPAPLPAAGASTPAREEEEE